MEPITDDFSLRKQNMFVVEYPGSLGLLIASTSGNQAIIHCTVIEKNCYDWLADNNDLTSRESSSPTFR